ncbi:Psmd10, partial [Symbiodinium sp. CCMP2456]
PATCRFSASSWAVTLTMTRSSMSSTMPAPLKLMSPRRDPSSPSGGRRVPVWSQRHLPQHSRRPKLHNPRRRCGASTSSQRRSVSPRLFTMYAVPLGTVLDMVEMKTFEELSREHGIVEFDEKHGACMFISHQWASVDHPDPELHQLRVLQEAMKNILRGSSAQISPNIVIELCGLATAVSSSRLTERPLFVWYDYFCCPQNSASAEDRKMAIRSIPSYVELCQHFVILCPPVRHAEHQSLLSKTTWATRGWCRLELVVRHLSARSSLAIEVTSASRLTLASMFDWVLEPVGEGLFTVEEDVKHVRPVLHGLVKEKLLAYLRTGKLHYYRALWNLQTVVFRNLEVESVLDLIPGMESNVLDPAHYSTEEFMYQNGFRRIDERDASGWTPLCYAALGGSPLQVSALLEARADANDTIKIKGPQFMNFGNNATALSICVFLKHNEAAKVLLSYRADPETRDSYGGTAMHRAASGRNQEGIHLLREHGANVQVATVTGHLPFLFTTGGGSRGISVLK